MAMAEPLTIMWNKLKMICSWSGWSYVIFWRIHPQNSLLLSMEEVHWEDELGQEMVNTVPQVHLVGEGLIGDAAYTGKHRWMHSDAQTNTRHHDDSGLNQQFSSGIKTVVMISVKPWGVVQFGSKEKILESVEFLEQIQRLAGGIEDESILSALTNKVLSQDCENYDLDGLLASISTENYDWNLKSVDGDNSEALLWKTYCPHESFPSMDKILVEDGINPMHGYSSHLGDPANAIEAQTVPAYKDIADVFFEPASSLNNSIARIPYSGTWSDGISSLDSLGQQLVSEDVHGREANAIFYDQLVAHQDLKLTSLYSIEDRLLDTTGTLEQSGNSLENQPCAQSSILTEANFPDNTLSMVHGLSMDDLFDTPDEFYKLFSVDDLSQLLAPSAEDSIHGTATTSNISLSQELNPSSFSVIGGSAIGDVAVTCPSLHDSFTCPTVLQHSMGLDWNSVVTPDHCIPELNAATLGGSRKRFFSEFLNSEVNCYSNIEYQLSNNKKQVTDNSSMNMNRNPIHLVQQHVPELVDKKFPTLKVGAGGLCIDDNRQSKCPEKAVKLEPNKRRAKPGETTRPRPKDRQQIHECIKVLRDIIPDAGEKQCSIDSLLDRTIKYMKFLRGIDEYANRLQEPSEPKFIKQEDGEAVEESSRTWRFEDMGPIIVEDMGPPGQMHIEMLCEEQGSFLEFVDIIRAGSGLNVLKAKMELRDNKMWARFIVEAKSRHVTTRHVFLSLTHLLQQTKISGMDSPQLHSNVADAAFSSIDNYPKTEMPANAIPFIMTNTIV